MDHSRLPAGAAKVFLTRVPPTTRILIPMEATMIVPRNKRRREATPWTDEGSRRHHYLPRFLLRPWTSEEGKVLAYRWHPGASAVTSKPLSPKSVGFVDDLLSLSSHPQGTDALEKQFFQSIDNAGAKVRDKVLSEGRVRLTTDERSDFARFLLSLIVRRPSMVSSIRAKGDALYRRGMNSDPALVAAMKALGLAGPPSELWEQWHSMTLEDAALLATQKLVDNTKLCQELIAGQWFVHSLGDLDGDLVITDHALVRLFGLSDPRVVWLLPLSPKLAFVLTLSRARADHIGRMSAKRFCLTANELGIRQADEYVFTYRTTPSLDGWIRKRLSSRGVMRSPGLSR
jgi:hypothetical protein